MLLAERRQVGNVVFEIPAGWRAKDINEQGFSRLEQTSTRAPCRFCDIGVHIGSPRDATFDEWLAERMAAVVDGTDYVPVGAPEVTTVATSFGEVRLVIRKLRRSRNVSAVHLFYAIELPTRYELLHVEGGARDAEQLSETMAFANGPAMRLLSSLEFLSEGAESLLGEPTPGPLRGVYWGRYAQSVMGANGRSQSYMYSRSYSFFPSGRFYEGVPPSGLERFDEGAVLRENPSKLGNYTVRERAIELTFADGSSRTLELDGELIRDRNATLLPAHPPADGFRFSGAQSSAIGTGGATGTRRVEFFVDGSYRSSRAASVGGSNVGGGAAASARGRYRVDGGVLELTDASGVTRVPILLQRRDGDDALIVDGDLVDDFRSGS